jgi:ZIP family zinc transporter/zinc and cadmium transporter
MLTLAIVLGLVTAVANLLGSYLAVVQRSAAHWTMPATLGFGGGFLLAAALLELLPESLEGGPVMPLFIAVGYLVIYVAEHLFAGYAHRPSPGQPVAHGAGVDPVADHTLAHEFHHAAVPLTTAASLAALIGFNIHDFLDGLAIGAGTISSERLGVVVFLAVLIHEAPAGFVLATIMRAAGHSRGVALLAGASIGLITLVGILVPFLLGDLSPTVSSMFLALSAGSFIYIAATDLIPAAMGRDSRAVFLLVPLGFGAFYGSDHLIGLFI